MENFWIRKWEKKSAFEKENISYMQANLRYKTTITFKTEKAKVLETGKKLNEYKCIIISLWNIEMTEYR